MKVQSRILREGIIGKDIFSIKRKRDKTLETPKRYKSRIPRASGLPSGDFLKIIGDIPSSNLRVINKSMARVETCGIHGPKLIFRNSWSFQLPAYNSSNNEFVKISGAEPGRQFRLDVDAERGYFDEDHSVDIPTKFVTPLRAVKIENNGNESWSLEEIHVSTIRDKIKLFRQRNPHKPAVENEDELELVREVMHDECPYITVRGFTCGYYTTDLFGDNSQMIFVRTQDVKGDLARKKRIVTQNWSLDLSRHPGIQSSARTPRPEFMQAFSSNFVDPTRLDDPIKDVGIYTDSGVPSKIHDARSSRNTWWFDLPVFDVLGNRLPEGIKPNEEFDIFKIINQKAYISSDLIMWIPTRFVPAMMLHGAEGRLRTTRPQVTVYILKDEQSTRIETDADVRVFCEMQIGEVAIKGRASHYVSFADGNRTLFLHASDLEGSLLLNEWYGFVECCFFYHRAESIYVGPTEEDDDDPFGIIDRWANPDPDPDPDPDRASRVCFQPSREPAQDEITVQDLIKFDRSNERYAPYVQSILDNIVSDSYCPRPGLYMGKEIEALAAKLTKIFRTIYLSEVICASRGNALLPHPVQVLSVLRLADEVLNGTARGAIAQIETGEGKSFIIAALSILLVLCGRKVDISTSNMELASRDEKEQKMYYNLFGIASDILYSTNTECAYVEHPPGPGHGSTEICEYSLDSLDAPIVYSTHTNYEFLHLRSLFYNTPFRERPYDVAIVDEADFALLDGARFRR
jgi:hypothetical protein